MVHVHQLVPYVTAKQTFLINIIPFLLVKLIYEGESTEKTLKSVIEIRTTAQLTCFKSDTHGLTGGSNFNYSSIVL